MCGLFATNRADLWLRHEDEIRKRLHHRGPDANGRWHSADDNVLLLHSRLEIVGLGPTGAQPADGGDITLVYNGEIFNHRSLSTRWGLPGRDCDTWLLHDLLQHRSLDALDELDGMFAFVAFDRRDKSLVLARDRFGVKPLYLYHHAEGGIAIASEASMLLPEKNARIDSLGVAQFLTFGHTLDDVTVWRGMTKLPPGSWARVRRTPDGSTAEQRGCYRTTTSAATAEQPESVVEALEQSVDRQLMADVPVGLFLSGGVDSTLVAAIAATHRPDLATFTVSVADLHDKSDEAAFAAHNATKLGLTNQTLRVSTPDLASAVRTVIASTCEPLGDPAVGAVKLLSDRAAEAVKVVLTGEGADEMLGGYARHRAIKGLRIARGRRTTFGRLRPAVARRRGDGPMARTLEAALCPTLVEGYAVVAAADSTMLQSGDPVGNDLRNLLRASWAEQDGDPRPDRAAAFDLHRWLPNTYLEKIDRATMSSSIEGRVPFLSESVATASRLRRGFGKSETTRALELRVPGVKVPTRKLGLSVPIARMSTLLREERDWVCRAQDSPLRDVTSDRTLAALVDRAARSPLLDFRLCALGVWLSAIEPR